MADILTVLGPIPEKKLGLTSMHEHILYDGSIYRRNKLNILPKDPRISENDKVKLDNIGILKRNPLLAWDALTMDDENIMLNEVAEFKVSGGSAMVDMSPPGIRSDIRAIKRISEKTGVHIILTTGLYTESSWPEKFRSMSLKQYVAYMLEEIETGIEETDIKAGHIKIAITDLTLQQEILLRAAGRVVNETGLSITVHPGFGIGNDGRRIAKILIEEDVSPERVVIAHAQDFFVEHDLRTLILDPDSWQLKLDYAKALLALGINLSIDTFGHTWDYEALDLIQPTDWQRLAGLVALIKEGSSKQLVLGTDTFIKIQTRSFGGEGYCRLTSFVLPVLRKLGVCEYDIRQMTLVNPAKLLTKPN